MTHSTEQGPFGKVVPKLGAIFVLPLLSSVGQLIIIYMQKKVEKMVEVLVKYCNICQKEIENEKLSGEYRERIQIVKYLFKTIDFDAHEKCINGVVKKAFKPFVTK